MKRILIVLALILTSASAAVAQNDGSQLWLGTNKNVTPCRVETLTDEAGVSTAVPGTADAAEDPTINIASAELRNGFLGKKVRLVLDTTMGLGEGYHLETAASLQEAVVYGSTPTGILYGCYELLRLQNTGQTADIQKTDKPAVDLRILNHWDNLDGTIERGYAGGSIWKWDEIQDGKLSPSLRDRLTVYARANASLGINGTVLNNVNASPKMMTAEYLHKVKAIADLLRPYGIRSYLSINFASPMALGYTKTADPLNKKVARWWQQKAKEIYSLIPDFGGFLVKANSEGQPGPGDYHRTHADGANMLADALKPYKGIVVWRSFVYGANHKGEDRVKQAVSEFAHLDGLFRDNVILQSKNGPLDFQPREPYAPIFDNIHKTTQMAELQITQEYLGQSKHLTYLAPMWKEFFSFVNPVKKLKGIAGVANIGDNPNWCGHPFSQANWYAFGRLAWSPDLSADEIAEEWLIQTYNTKERDFIYPVKTMMLTSREACVNYMMPLGLHHIFKFDHHYGPEPDGYKADYPIEWCPVYYHKATKDSIGFDRSSHGTDAVAQYREPYRSLYDNLQTCPEEYLLWFHRLPWNYPMKSGLSLWQELCQRYQMGVDMVKVYKDYWHTCARKYMKGYETEWQQTDSLLSVQLDNAQEWRDTCLKYFQTFSGMKTE